jgi:hypothetical protein
MKNIFVSRNWKLFLLFVLIGLVNFGAAQNKSNKISSVYRLINEVKDGFEICIVDGPLIRKKIYLNFYMEEMSSVTYSIPKEKSGLITLYQLRSTGTQLRMNSMKGT